MKIMKIDIIFIFLLLGWIDTAISRSAVKGRGSAVKGRFKSSNQLKTNNRNLSLDLSSDGPDPSASISQIFISTVKELQPQMHLQQSVSIALDITAPPGSREKYLENIEGTLRNLLRQLIPYPMQSFINTRIQGNDDGTIASIIITVSILSSEKTSKDFGSIDVDLSKPNVDIIHILRTSLSIAVQSPSIRANGDKSNHITLEIIPPQRFTKANVHEIIGDIESILITILPNTKFSIKASISQNSAGVVTHISCVIKIDEMTSEKNSFSYNIDMAKTKDGLDRRIINILQNIQRKVEIIFNQRKPVFLNFKIKPLPKSNKQSIVNTIDTIMTTLKKIFSNRIELTVNIYENSRREINFLILDIIIEPINAIEIDLTELDSTSIQQINYEVTKLKSDLTDRGPIDKSTSFTLMLQTPENADEKIVEKITHVVMSTISRIFPEYEISVQAKSTKNNKGSVSKITLVITIEPNSEINNRKKEDIVQIDLSIPGIDLTQQLSKILPRLKNKLNKKPSAPIRLTLSVEPPKKSTKVFIRNTLTTILSTLSESFPQERIESEVKAEEDPQGYLKNLKLIFTFIPGTSPEEPKNAEILNINLIDSGSNLVSEITKILPRLKNKLNKKPSAPISLTLSVEPPKKSTKVYIRNTLTTILSTLSESFPQERIESEVKAEEDPQGYLKNLKLIFTIIPGTSPEEPKNAEILNINLIDSGSNLVSEITNILPKLNRLIETGQTANLNLKIQPPPGANDEIMKNIVKSVIKIVSEKYPNNKLESQVQIPKNAQGISETVNILLTIKPTNESRTKRLPEVINLNLTVPGKNLIKEMTNIVPMLKTKTSENREKGIPVRLNLKIDPPKGATTDYVKKTANSVLTIISKLFPQDQVSVKAKMKKTPLGELTEITLIITIEPKLRQPNTDSTKTTTPSEASKLSITPSTTQTPNLCGGINLDLSKPGTNIPGNIATTLRKMKLDINLKKKIEKTATFQLNIQPPIGSNQQFVENTVNTALKTLTELFPNDRIEVKSKIFRNKDKIITNVTLFFVISPTNINRETETTTENIFNTAPTSDNVHEVKLDLSNPEINIPEEVTAHILEIKSEVTKNNPEDQPVNFKLNIQPPKGSTEEDVKKTMNVITRTISDLFPDKKIAVNLHMVKNPDGSIRTITMVLNIEPSSNTQSSTITNIKPDENTHETTTSIYGDKSPSTPNEAIIKINLDLSKPGTTIVSDVVKILPDINYEVMQKHPKGKPVQIQFNINPPDNSSTKSIKAIVKSIVKILKTVYPDNKIDNKIKLVRDEKNKIMNVNVVLSIEPSTRPKLPFGVHLVTKETPNEYMQTTETTLSHKTSTPNKNIPTKVELDLSKPESNVVRDILTIIPTIEKVVNTEHPKKNPFNIELLINPPVNSTEETVQQTTKTILEIFENKFPNEKIKFSLKLGKTKNTINKVIMVLTIEPSPSTVKNMFKHTTEIDEEITKSVTDHSEPEMKSSTRTTPNEYMQTTETTLSHKTSTPNRKMPTKVELDLSKPESNVVRDILTIIPTIAKVVNTEHPKKTPFNIELLINPPVNSTEETVQQTTKTILEIFENKFPNEKIKFSLKLGKTKNTINKVIMVLTIEPSPSTVKNMFKHTTEIDEEITKSVTDRTEPEMKSSTRTTPNEYMQTTETTLSHKTSTPNRKMPTKVELDLSKPESNVVRDILTIIPTIEKVVNTEHPKKKPFNIELLINPPVNSTEETVQQTTKTILEIFENKFPNEKIKFSLKLGKTKNTINKVIMVLTIEPSPSTVKNMFKHTTEIDEEITKSVTDHSEPEMKSSTRTTPNEYMQTTETTLSHKTSTPNRKMPTKVELDLSKPESNVVRDILTIIPTIAKVVNTEHPKKTPFNIELLINPPVNSTEETVQQTTKTILEIFENKFPNEKIKFSLKLGKTKNTINEVIMVLTIEPSPSTVKNMFKHTTELDEEITKSVTDQTEPEMKSSTLTTPSDRSKEESIAPTEDNNGITESNILEFKPQKETFNTTPTKSEKTSKGGTGSGGRSAHSIAPSSTPGIFEESTIPSFFTTSPSTGDITSKEYTTFEESTPLNEEITKSSTGKSRPQKQLRTTTPSTFEITFKETTSPSKEITETEDVKTRPKQGSSTETPTEDITSEYSTISYEDKTKLVTRETESQMGSSTTTHSGNKNTIKAFSRTEEEITPSVTEETKPQRESSTVTPSKGEITSREYTTFEESTPRNEDITKSSTGRTRPQKQLRTTTHSTFEETTSPSEETTETKAEKTRPQQGSSTETPSEDITSEYSTKSYEDKTKLVTRETESQMGSSTTTHSGNKNTIKAFSRTEEEITASVTEETKPQRESSTVTPSKGEITSREYTTFEESTPRNEDITKSSTGRTRPLKQLRTTTPSAFEETTSPSEETTETKAEKTRPQQGSSTETPSEDITSEYSTKSYEDKTKLVTRETESQMGSSTTTHPGDKNTIKAFSRTEEEITASVTQETKPQRESSTVTPSKGEITSREYTTFEESTPRNEDITKSSTGKTRPQKQLRTTTPSTFEITFEETTSPSEETTETKAEKTRPQQGSSTETPSEDITSKYSTISYEDLTKLVTRETEPQIGSSTTISSGDKNTIKASTRTEEEITGSVTAETKPQKESSTVIPSKGEITSKEYTTFEESTPRNEDITKYFTGKTRPQKQLRTTTPSTFEITFKETTSSDEEITEIKPVETRPQHKSSTETSAEDVTSEYSTTSYEDMTKLVTRETESEIGSSTNTPSGDENTPKESSTTEEGIAELVITETKPHEESTTVFSTKDEITSKEYTSFEEFTPRNEDITKSSTGKTRQLRTTTPSIFEITFKETTSPSEEIIETEDVKARPQQGSSTDTPEGYITSKYSTVSYKDMTNLVTRETESQIGSSTTTSKINKPTGESTFNEVTEPEGRAAHFGTSSTTQKIYKKLGTPSGDEYITEESTTPNVEITHWVTPSQNELSSTTNENIWKKFPITYEDITKTPNETPNYIIPETKPTKVIIKKPQNKQLDIDLSRPGSTLSEEVTHLLPSILPDVTSELAKKSPITINFVMKPPNGSTESYLQPTIQSLGQILTNCFPENKINVQVNAQKNPQGFLSEVTILVTIEPSTIQKPQNKKLDIDLSRPGSTLSEEVTHLLPTILPDVTSELAKKSPITINFVMKPPNGSTESYLQPTIQSLGQILSNYFPENKINVQVNAQKNPQGFLSEVTILVTIEPSTIQKPQNQKLDIDLSRPGSTLSEEVTRLLPSILPDVTSELAKKSPITINFVIKPPNGSTESYLQPSIQSLGQIISNYFPENKINVQVNAQKNPQGFLSEATILVTIEPSIIKKPQNKQLDIDLSRPGSTLSEEVTRLLPSILPDVTSELAKKSPITINFVMKPPNGSTESYLQPTIQSLGQTLTNYFPENKINVQVNAQKNPQGFLSEVTILVTIEPSTIQKPQNKKLDIDLSRPGSTLSQEVTRLLPSILPDVTSELAKKSPITINFVMKPPNGSTENYLQPTIQSLEQIISNYFPENKINIQVNAQKNPQGFLSEATILVTIEPSILKKPQNKQLDIDLSRPGSTLSEEVTRLLPSILPDVTSELTKKSPITINFVMKPPNGSTESYLQPTIQSLGQIFTNYFPENKINVQVNAQKNPQGFLSEATILVTIEPSTIQKPQNKKLDIDLSRPGSTLSEEVTRLLPSILPDVTSELAKKSPITINFVMKPPNGSTESYLQPTIQSVGQILTNYFPENKINVQVNAQKNPQGFLSEVTILVTIEPSTIQKPQNQKLDIDLSRPGSTLSEEVTRLLPSILPDVTSELAKKSPITISFVMKPPNGSTESYLQPTIQSLGQTLTNYFPENKINVQVNAQKNPQGFLSEVTILVTIEPSTIQKPQNQKLDIDLSRPGSTLSEEVTRLLPSILPDVTSELAKKSPITINFVMKPPNGSTESYLQPTIQSVGQILTNYFPENKINVQVNAQKNPQGFLSEVTILVTIEPSTIQKPQNQKLDIDLSRPGSTLSEEVTRLLPSILPDVTSELAKKSPITINFVMKPPNGSTESYLQPTIQSVGQILTNYFPENKINVQVNAQKNPQGFLSEVTILVTIEPSIIQKPQNQKLDIDLSRPGSTLSEEVTRVLPSILPDVTSVLAKKSPITINFVMKPPNGSTESYLQPTIQSLVQILKNYFPNNKINVQIQASKNLQGYITIVMIEVTLQPPEKSTPTVEDVDIDLTKPGENLMNQVTQKIPYILNNIREKLSKKQPMTLNFKIKPPSGSTESYLQILGNSLLTILKTYFPNNKINVQMNAQKNSQGYLTEVTIEIIIQPSSTGRPENDDVDIDLTEPGATLPNQMEKILPNIRQNVTEQLATNHPVFLSFKIKPPKGSTESYLQVITESLQSILMKYFPINKMSVELSAQKDSQGYITEVTIEINLTPSIIQPPNNEDVDIDLSKPGVTLTNRIPGILSKILPNVTKELSAKRPVTLNFKIRPPPRATDSYLQVTAETLEALLAKYLPGNPINVEISAQKNSQNQLSLITIQITIQPSTTQMLKKRNALIDLTKPGVNLIDQVNECLTTLSSNVTAQMDNGQSVNITLDIKPPYGATESYIQIISESVIPVLKRFFPNNKVNIETSADKDSRGYLTEISLMINIEGAAKHQDYTVDIDLMKSKFTLVEQVDNFIPNILQRLQDDLNSGESVTLSFKVLPPNGSRENYLQTFSQDLIPILTKFFPGNRMSIKSSAQKNSQGFLINITVQITIQTSIQTRKIDIDLSRPRSISLENQVSNMLPKILPGLETDLEHGKPITLSFNIRPPTYSNRAFQSQIANQLVQILPKYFPRNRMSIKTSSEEDANGFISDIIITITIMP